jgi:hypothetical protein
LDVVPGEAEEYLE